MDERKPAHNKDDDVPIIGDYSEAANARLRAESPRAPSPPPAPAASRTGAEQWRVDPGDVRRHVKLMRQRERAGPLARVFRYGFAALALVIAFAVYWNLDKLRAVTLDFSTLTDLFSDSSGSGSGPSILRREPETVVVEAGGVAGADVPTTLDDTPQAEDGGAAGTRAGNASAAEQGAASRSESSTAETDPPAIAALAEPSPGGAPVSSPSVPPAAAPEPPAGPETFEFGLSVISVSEADASAAVIILRNGDRRRASSVTWWTGDGTATADVDYANLGKIVERFAAGEQNRTIHIPIVGDRNVEGAENFYVYLAASESAAAAEPPERLEVLITDDD